MKLAKTTIFVALALIGALCASAKDSWAQIRLSVACMREEPRYAAEQGTQAIMGMPVKVLDEKNGWIKIESPDGYQAWVWNSSITKKTEAELAAWRKAPRLIVTDRYETVGYDSPTTTSPRHTVTDLVNGCIVEGSLDSKIVNGRVEVTLPDSRKCWVDTASLTPIEKWAAQDFDPDVILDQAYALEGHPYMWGGTSTKGVDCSGLVRVGYFANGFILKRNASQQARLGTRLEAKDWPSYMPGDLLFFGNNETGKVTHVALYDHDGKIIHSAGSVKRNSCDPKSPDYLQRKTMWAVRLHGHEGEEGITQVRNHPWFF